MARIEARVIEETGKLPEVEGTASAPPRSGGFRELVASGSLGRLTLLMTVWMCQTLGIYGFLSWVPTLLVEHGFSVVRSLEQSSAMSIGAVPGAWIASRLSDRWERKSLIGIVAVVIAICGLSYGLSFRTTTIVIFGFLVAMGQQVFAALLYVVHAGMFPDSGAEYRNRRLLRNGTPRQRPGRSLHRCVSVQELRLHDGLCLHRRVLGGCRDSDDVVRSEDAWPSARVKRQRVAVARARTTDEADDIES